MGLNVVVAVGARALAATCVALEEVLAVAITASLSAFLTLI